MSTLILDHGTGTNGNALNGRTPDTTNTPGGTWVDGGGGWTVQSNRLQVGAGFQIANLQAGQANVSVSCVINNSSGGTTGIILRYTDDNNFIGGFFIPGGGGSAILGIFKRVAGSFTTLNSTNLSASSGVDRTITLSASAANLITILLDGGTTCSATDAAGATNTKVGLYSSGATGDKWDDFQVDTVSSGATAYTLTGPSSGQVNVASTNFTVTPNGTYTGTITPATSGTGTFSPSSLTFSGSSAAQTFTYTPTTTSGSPHTVSTTSSPGLTDPSGIAYTVSAGTIAIGAPVANQWKRGGGSSVTFTVSGTYTGSPTHVEVSTDGGSNWATLDSSPSAGAYTGTTSLAASETDYTISVRFSNSTGITASVAGIANLRTVIGYGGQSNEAGRGTNNQTATQVFGSDAHKKKTAAGYAVLADPTGTDGSAAGSYAIHEANILGIALGHRVGIANFAVGATTIADWQKATGMGYYQLLAAAVTAVGGVCDILRMGPCEQDAGLGTSQATYHAALAAFVASWLADFPGTKIVWRTLQEMDIATEATQAHQDAINAAILAAAGSTHGHATGDVAGVYLAEVRSYPATTPSDPHWRTDQQLADVGGIMATADYIALNPAAGGGLLSQRGFTGGYQ